SGLHAVDLGVEWAQPDSVCEMLDGGVRLAVPGPKESGEEPGRREIGIEYERPVEQGDAAGDVIGEDGERMPAAGERDRIVPAPGRRPGAPSGHPRRSRLRDRSSSR